jgi:hypothetical protein
MRKDAVEHHFPQATHVKLEDVRQYLGRESRHRGAALEELLKFIGIHREM